MAFPSNMIPKTPDGYNLLSTRGGVGAVSTEVQLPESSVLNFDLKKKIKKQLKVGR